MGDFKNAVLDAATGGIGGVVSGGVNALFGALGIGARRQQRMQQENMQLQHSLNEQAANAALEREKNMYDYTYNKTTYSAMRKQMEDAGLSVGLMYGGGGAGGAGGGITGSGAMGTTGLGAAGRPMAIQTDPMMMAQIENMKADTELKKSQADEHNANKSLLEAQAQRIIEMLPTEIRKNLSEAEINELNARAMKWQQGEDVGITDASPIARKTLAEIGRTEAEIVRTENEAQRALMEAVKNNAQVAEIFGNLAMGMEALRVRWAQTAIAKEANTIRWAELSETERHNRAEELLKANANDNEWEKIMGMNALFSTQIEQMEHTMGKKVNWKDVLDILLRLRQDRRAEQSVENQQSQQMLGMFLMAAKFLI